MKWDWRRDGLRCLALLLLAFFYVSPGGEFLLKGRHDRSIGAGHEPLKLPYVYETLRDRIRDRPAELFYGTVATNRLNPPDGFALRLPWSENIFAAAAGTVIPAEQLSAAYLIFILFLSAAAFYAMGRVLDWQRTVALALAIAWAFNAFTRGRAAVHVDLAGAFHLPLIVLGIHFAVKGRGQDSVMAAAALFLAASGVGHDFQILTLFTAPALFLLTGTYSEFRQDPRRTVSRLAAALLPAALLMAFHYGRPVPLTTLTPETVVQIQTHDLKPPGQQRPEDTPVARPVDYFTGDIGLGPGEINPVRGWLNNSVANTLGMSGPFERANGIRWLVWFAFAAAVFVLLRIPDRLPWTPEVQRRAWCFILFGSLSMIISMGIFGGGTGSGVGSGGGDAAALGIRRLFQIIHAPARAAIFVHFAVLLVAGDFLHSWLYGKPAPSATKFRDRLAPLWPRPRKFFLLAGTLPFLAVLEMPPLLNSLPVTGLTAPRADLADGRPCGYGLYFPYASGTWAPNDYFAFLQSMRGSRCKIINAVTATSSERNQWLMQTMPLHEELFKRLGSEPSLWQARLVRFAECVPLDWYVFDKRVPQDFIEKTCAKLGWKLTSPDTCRGPEGERAFQERPEACWK
jgi:hypothetical protein